MKRVHRSTLWRNGVRAKTPTFRRKTIKRDYSGRFISGTGRYITSGNPRGNNSPREESLKSLQASLAFLCGVFAGFALGVTLMAIPGVVRADTSYVFGANVPEAMNCVTFVNLMTGLHIDRHATQWIHDSMASTTPVEGDIAVQFYGFNALPWEWHVSLVEAVTDGNVWVLESNYAAKGAVDLREAPISEMSGFIHVQKSVL